MHSERFVFAAEKQLREIEPAAVRFGIERSAKFDRSFLVSSKRAERVPQPHTRIGIARCVHQNLSKKTFGPFQLGPSRIHSHADGVRAQLFHRRLYRR